MKIKTSELTGAALDWAVVRCEGFAECDVYGLGTVTDKGFAMPLRRGWEAVLLRPVHDKWYDRCEGYPWGKGQVVWEPSTKWEQAGPIIERERIMVAPSFTAKASPNSASNAWEWVAYILGPTNLDDNCERFGQTPLIAAMRCYAASKFGDEIDVPDDLLNK